MGGEKVTLMVQVPPGAREPQLLVWANWVLFTDTPLTESVPAPMLVIVTVCASEVVRVDWPPKSIDAGLAIAVGDPAAVVNVAETDVAAFIVTMQVPVPLHAPDQPANTEPLPAAADSVTGAPVLKFAVHVAPQLMPAGTEVTVPVPDFVTVSAWPPRIV